MTRLIPVCALLLALPSIGSSGDKPAPTETVIRMKVQATHAPKPALRYQLLPELREMNPGNPIHGYLKCYSEQRNFFYSKEANDEREKWEAMPLKDLPVEEMRGYGGLALKQADYAARLDNPDWQILLKLKSEGIFLLVPDLQQMRSLAYCLQIRFRGEVADRRFDDALVTAKTMFALSRHVGEHPTMVGHLVGLAIASVAIAPLEEMIPQPGCPNLFWALTDLPQPFIDPRKALQGERMILMNEFALLDEKTPMTDAQVQKAITRFQNMFDELYREKSKQKLNAWLTDLAMDKAHVGTSRKRLIEYGLPENAVKQFPALHSVFLAEKLTYEERRDNALKGLMLPYWQVQTLKADNKPKEDSPFARLVPTLSKVRQAQARLDQRFALLRCVEALRLHAAEHDGKLPEKLADIKLPLPVDPITGQEFHYKLEAGTAFLRGTPPAGGEKVAAFNIRYEITIAK